MSLLFTPVEIGSLRARNRLWVAPMCQYSSTDGMPNTWHLTHLSSFASGGAGLVMTEATAVSPEGRISPDDTGIWNDQQRDAWAPIASEIRSRGALAAIQLAHAGRKASTWSPLKAGRGSV
ncbi:MAG TPA: oxidoreductase, partial [Microbacterium sp.]|nr:oxidoreductase [Microbacterium sp.]